MAESKPEIEVTPEMIEAGARVLTRRWMDLADGCEEDEFLEISAEILREALLAWQSHQLDS